MTPIDEALAMITLTRNDWLYAILFSAVVVFGNGVHYLISAFCAKISLLSGGATLACADISPCPRAPCFCPLVCCIVLPIVPKIPAVLREPDRAGAECLLVLFLGWFAIGGVYVFQAFTLSRFDTSVADNLRARRVHTQMQFFRRLLIFIVLLLDAGALLWSLHDPQLWKYGTGLLASAGLASLVLATAAKSTASNLIAGMQIALSEPIRIDDVVVIRANGGGLKRSLQPM